MRRLTGLAALILSASAAMAQDTTVVIVRHLPAAQDTGVTVRHLAPAPVPAPRAATARYGAPRYALRGSTVFAKDPNVGTMLSFVFPGGGQYYAGMTGKGIAITAISIAAPIVGYANVTHSYNAYNEPCAYPGCSGGRRTTDWSAAWLGLGVGVGTWLYGVATAAPDVQHWNRVHGVRFIAAPGRMGFAVAVP